MGTMVLENSRLFVVGADLTGNTNKIEIDAEVDEQDTTNFGSAGWKEVLGGIASTKITGSGQWEAGDASKVDDARWAGIGGTGPWTIAPVDATVGAVCYLTKALQSKYTILDEVGNVAPWEADASSTWPLVRGRVAHPPGTARTATGTGTGQQLGAAAAGQQLYVALHVLSVAGTDTPSITVAVESDADNTFASATTQLTATTATAVGGQVLRTAGPVTDTWYRIKWTITGTTPSFLFVAAIGIK